MTQQNGGGGYVASAFEGAIDGARLFSDGSDQVVGGLGLSSGGPSAGSIFSKAQSAGYVTRGSALARTQSYAATEELGGI